MRRQEHQWEPKGAAMAMTVKAFRQVLRAAGFDPNLVTLAIDTTSEPIGKVLIKHPKTAIVDFTGSVRFGQWVEQNAHPALAFTETAGCNTVVLESTQDLDAALRNLATTMCLFSAICNRRPGDDAHIVAFFDEFQQIVSSNLDDLLAMGAEFLEQ